MKARYTLKAYASSQTGKFDSLEAAQEAAKEMDLSSGANITEQLWIAGWWQSRPDYGEWRYDGPLSDEWIELCPGVAAK